MDILKLNKQLKDNINQHVSDISNNVCEEAYNWMLDNYDHQLEINDPSLTPLYTGVSIHLAVLNERIMNSLVRYTKERENLSALKGCYLEDEDSEEEYPFLSESEEFEDSEITKI